MIIAAEAPKSVQLDLHPVLKVTRQKLLSPTPAGGPARASGKGAFTVSVSPQQAARALLVLSQLLQAVERRGWSVTDSQEGLQLRAGGEAVRFTLIEQMDRIRHKVTDAERAVLARFEAKRAAAARDGDWFGAGDPPQIPDWDHRPTGYLIFQLDPNPCAFDAGKGLRRTFGESRLRRLDDQLERIMEALGARAAATQEIRRLAAEQAVRWADLTAKREDAERRQRLEAKRLAFLDRQLEHHEAARRLEDFLARYDQGDLRQRPQADKFLNWARDRLARLSEDLMLQAQEARYAKVGLDDDEADIPTWKTLD